MTEKKKVTMGTKEPKKTKNPVKKRKTATAASSANSNKGGEYS